MFVVLVNICFLLDFINTLKAHSYLLLYKNVLFPFRSKVLRIWKYRSRLKKRFLLSSLFIFSINFTLNSKRMKVHHCHIYCVCDFLVFLHEVLLLQQEGLIWQCFIWKGTCMCSCQIKISYNCYNCYILNFGC